MNKCPTELPTQQQQQQPRQQIKVKKKKKGFENIFTCNLLATSIFGGLLLAGSGSMSLRSDEKLKGVKKSGEKTRLREINDGGVLFG